ncbi:hypothetical protein P4133_13565 [Pseudomonas aeruginosa]|nr:hypothetical protein [Pseudomonas aeruginosa]
MAQIIDVTIPSSMNPSVKDAMQYVMSRSGYSLCPADAGHVNILYTRPLPAAQYKLGPMTLRNTLQVLLSGPAWQVKVDEVARQVCFVLRPGYQLPRRRGRNRSSNCYAKPAAPTPPAVAQPSSTEKSARWSRPSWSPRCRHRRRSQPATLRPRSLNPPCAPPSRTGQGWPPLFSSRGFGTDQACGLRREVHAAHSTHRGFRPTGQGAHAAGTEPAAGTGLVSRDGINPARHLGSLGKSAHAGRVRWEPQDLNYPIEAPLTFHGSFEDAVSELFPCMTLPNGPSW